MGALSIANAIRPLTKENVEAIAWLAFAFFVSDTIEFIHERLRNRNDKGR